MSTGPDGIATVPESEAAGEIAAIYDDFRTCSGTPVVNLVWRHLAALPGALPWVWQTVRPLYADGVLAAELDAFEQSVEFPALSQIPAEAMMAAGVPASDIPVIGRMFASYNIGNGKNMLAFLALRSALRDEPPAARRPSPPAGAGRTVPGSMPRLLAMSELEPEVAAVVTWLNSFGSSDDGELMLSIYRHMGHWPGFLSLLWGLLAPLQRDGALLTAVQACEAEAAGPASALRHHFGTPDAVLDAATRQQVLAALDRFLPNAIIKMIPIGYMVERALPPSAVSR